MQQFLYHKQAETANENLSYLILRAANLLLRAEAADNDFCFKESSIFYPPSGFFLLITEQAI
jgi:hypothetical protein